MTKKIAMRLQTPPDENGERCDVHVVTTADEVIVDPNSENPSTLTKRLDQIGTVRIQKTQPAFPCIWAKPVDSTTP